MIYKEPKAIPVTRKGISQEAVMNPGTEQFRIGKSIKYVGLIGTTLFLYKEKPGYDLLLGKFGDFADDELYAEPKFYEFFKKLGSFKKTEEILFKIV